MFTQRELEIAMNSLLNDSLDEYEDTGIFNSKLTETEEIALFFIASMTGGVINNQKSIIQSNIRQYPSFANDLVQITNIFKNSLSNRVFNTVVSAIDKNKDKKTVTKSNSKYIKNYAKNLTGTLKNAVDFHGRLLTNQLGLTHDNFKTWNYTPNEHTRHSKMDGTKIPIKDYFWVLNEVSNVVEKARYPRDPMLSAANAGTCYCYLSYSEV